MPYSDRLKRLDLESLELRRLYADLIICYKIVFGLVDLHMYDLFALSTVTHTQEAQLQALQEASSSHYPFIILVSVS